MFQNKPTIYKLLYELRVEEAEIVNTFNKRSSGLLGHEIRRNTKTQKLQEILDETIEEINMLPSNSNEDKEKITQAWFDCLKSLGMGF